MDELERLRARNAELEAALAKGAPNLVTRPEPPSFKRSDLRDAAFFAAHRRDILDAASHGRIIDDLPARDLETAIANRLRPSEPPPDREQARLQGLADRFVPDPQLEATIAARSKDPAAYDREMARVGAYQGMELAIYQRSRDAAIALKTWTPDAPKEGSK
jgi:hypothetical protein